MEIIERLDPKVIARHKQGRSGGAQVADREGKHAVQPLYAIRPLLLVKMNDHLGVGVRGEAMALAFEFLAKFGEVEDLPVVGDPDGAVLVAHRHVANCRKIENRETTTAEADVGTVGERTVPHA